VTTKDTIDQLFRDLNGAHRDVADTLIAHLRTEHRTLQQSFWRVIQTVAREYQKFDSDLRNESAVAFAKDVAGIDRPLPLL
jgi:hypothetical protein